MKTITFYQVLANMDRTEGRGPMYPTDFAFINKEDAQDFTQTKYYQVNFGVQGTKGYPTDVKLVTLRVFEKREECESLRDIDNIAAMKAQALAKLTDVERKLLGL